MKHIRMIGLGFFSVLLGTSMTIMAFTAVRYTQGNPLEGGAVIIVWGIIVAVISTISINKLART